MDKLNVCRYLQFIERVCSDKKLLSHTVTYYASCCFVITFLFLVFILFKIFFKRVKVNCVHVRS